MTNFYDQYDDEAEEREKGKTQLDAYFSTREAELAEREQQLREREREALEFYHSTEAKKAHDAARFRNAQLEITPEMNGEDVIRLYKKHGI